MKLGIASVEFSSAHASEFLVAEVSLFDKLMFTISVDDRLSLEGARIEFEAGCREESLPMVDLLELLPAICKLLIGRIQEGPRPDDHGQAAWPNS